MHNWYKKLNNFLVALLLIAQVFVTPFHAFAQEESTSANIVEVDSTLNNEVDTETPSDASEITGEEEKPQEETEQLESEESSSSAEEESKEDEEIMASQLSGYTTSTDFKINANPVKNNAQYGEGKFYITPTFTFPDEAQLHNGDTILYTIPEPFKVDAALSSDVTAGGVVIARLETTVGSKVAKLTITNEDYFANLNESKKITPSFTVVWDHAVALINKPVTFELEGYPANPLTLTRILIDEELDAHSKWGSQSKDDLTLVDWRIRVNRDVKAIGPVTLVDEIPDNQELVGPITGLYFDSWNFAEQRGNYLSGPARDFDSSSVQIEDNKFTINLPDMSDKGVILMYKTRIVGEVDKVNKKVYNKLTMTSNEGTFTKDHWFASLRVVDGIGEGARSDRIAFEVKKELEGRELKADEFEFELFDTQQNKVVQTVKNDANGVVKFKSIKFSNEGQFIYKIREKASNLPGVTNDANAEITATVTVTDQGGAKTAAVVYDRDTFVNRYKAAPTSVNLTARKTLDGKDLADQQYVFTIEEADVELQSKLNQANGTVTFDAIPITEAGTRTFVVREVSGVEAGITYDKSVYTATVVTTDDGNGQLNATTTITKDGAQVDGITFTNTYKAAPVTVAVPTVKKALTGKDLEADKYTFELKEGDAVKQEAKNQANGTVAFAELSFDTAGEYTYTISEKRGTEGGVTYDESVYTWKVTVTDDKAGKLVAVTELKKADEVVEEAVFTNAYKAAPITVAAPTVKKALTGKDLEADKYTFELKEGNAVKQEAKNQANGTVAFAELSFDTAGEYTYTISEKRGTEGGVTYDESVYTWKVTVTDDKAGKLVAVTELKKADEVVEEAVFTNAYKAAPITIAAPTVKKALTGKDLEADKYTFELKEGNAVKQEAKNQANGTVAFAELSFDTAGEYTYTISEKRGTEGGVTYDESVYTWKVTVTDDKAGKLVAVTELKKSDEVVEEAVFTNTYKAAPVTVAAPTVKKALTGKDLEADKYTFELKEGDAVKQAVTNAADGTVTFDGLTFNAPGEYTYTISEKRGTEGGVTYDESVYTWKVTVTDDKAGKLVAVTELKKADEVVEEAVFTNAYKAAPITIAAPTVKKALTGKDLEADKYTFELKEGNAVKQEAKNQANGTVAFAELSFDTAGEYTYTISEKRGTEGGVTYDESVYTWKVTVTDDKAGKLVAVTELKKSDEVVEEAVFTNTYKAAPVTVAAPTVKKALTGKDLEADKYTFELKEGDAVKQAVTNAADGTVTFDGLTFNAPGEYTYTISEKRGTEGGVTYDESVYTWKVTVTDNKAGQLVAATELTKAGAVVKEVAFTNTYTPAPVNVAVQATKTLTGRPLKEGEFEFELVDAKGAVAKATRNTADGTIAFAPITFDRAGEYVYTIREKASNQPGVTDDATPATVTITVTDNKAGQLEAQVAYTKNAFNNAYQGAPVNVVVQTMKTLTGRPLKAGEFEFELVDAQDKVVTKASNTANGAVAFDALTFDKAGEYVYTIREVATTLPGVTNDTETATVTITVVDNLKGQLEATAKYSKENFVNTYKAKDGTATISIAKVLEGRKQAAGEFEFELKDSTGKVLQTAKNTADGQVNFNKLTYDAAGVYEYTVVEKAGNAKGVTYDKEPILVKVTVEDKDAQLETTVEYAEKKGFKNTYVPAPTTAQAQGTTVLKGIDVPAHKERKLEAGQFEFTLTDTQTGQVTKVTNTADGKVVFEGIPYTKAGKYTYKMNELKGTDPSITYSDLEVLVTVDVVDNNGQLEATVSYDKTPEFVNTYTVAPDPISVTLNVKKELSGRELKADEFEFVLFDAAGKEVQTAKNAKDGQVAFTTTFDKEGVSTFKINEKRGNDATIKYADNTVNVEVSVTKEKGVLVAKVTYKDAAVFKNEYKAPTKEERQLPKTGEWNTGFILPVALFAMVGAVAVLTFKKKQN